MHIYLSENPRTLYLVTSWQEEQQGRPGKALVFRAAEAKASQAIVEFLPKDEIDLSNAVKLSNRIVKGCLGLISIADGTYDLRSARYTANLVVSCRHISLRRNFRDRRRKPTTLSSQSRVRSQDTRSRVLLLDFCHLG